MASKSNSITQELLRALIPFTQQNLKLSFKPGLFFSDLEKITRAKRATLHSTMYRAKRYGYISMSNDVPVLTGLGRAKLGSKDTPALLRDWLLVAYDIPESRRRARYELRTLLKSLKFQQLQKSLWCSRYDYSMAIQEAAVELKVSRAVKIFYASPPNQTGL